MRKEFILATINNWVNELLNIVYIIGTVAFYAFMFGLICKCVVICWRFGWTLMGQ